MSDIGSSAIAGSSSSSTNRAAKASTRRPFSPIRSFAASIPERASAIGTCEPLSGPPEMAAAREHDVGAALDELDHALRPVHGARGGTSP